MREGVSPQLLLVRRQAHLDRLQLVRHSRASRPRNRGSGSLRGRVQVPLVSLELGSRDRLSLPLGSPNSRPIRRSPSHRSLHRNSRRRRNNETDLAYGFSV